MASSMGEKGEIMTKCKNFVDLDYPNLVPRVEKGIMSLIPPSGYT